MKPAPSASSAGVAAWVDAKPPLLRFLDRCHTDFKTETGGAVADYIPELGKADPDHFGISLATLDGHVYEVGDTTIPFTIQSMSKPFVFALALDTLGAAHVESAIGVEPSGDPFNSIRLNSENHPFNPMVNAGAITCSGLLHETKGSDAFDYIRQALGRFAGRELGVDEAVYASESATGDRNRAIGYLLRTNAVIKDNVAAVLDVYFRQCAVLVTARDIAVMAATLANRGVNPVTGEQVLTPYAISRTLSVMTSSGMYDYAGEWIYRIGIPAKSGVGGGILAALPARLGLGSYSPKLDKHGNSVRGIKVRDALSSHYDLHRLNRIIDDRNSIIAAGNPATSLFFLRSGVVHVTLPDGIRLATLTAGMPFGEMALLEPRRSADVFADMAATAYEIPLRDFERFRKQHPRAGERIMRNLAQLLADRLILANAKLNLLTPS